MKQFLLALGCLIFIGSSGFSYGQMVTVHDQSAPGFADGYAFFNQAASYTGTPWSWRWTLGDSTLIQTGSDTIGGLYEGNFAFHLDSAGIEIYSEPFVIGNGDPCNAFIITSGGVTNTDSSSCTGSIAPVMQGGSAPYVFSWSTGQTTYSPQNLCVGTYTVTVMDNVGCTATHTYTISDTTVTNPCTLMILPDGVTNTGGGLCTGSITPVIQGGAATSYNWSNFAGTTFAVSNLCPGAYTLTAVDNMGCTAVHTYIITDTTTNPCTLVILPDGVTNSAPNACTGSINPVVQGGYFTGYVWSNAETVMMIDDLCPGQYELYITDTNGCSASMIYTVGEDSITPSLIDINLEIANDSTGLCTGMAAVSPTGGTAPYTIYWSNGVNNDFAANLCAGIYSVMVYDAAGDTTYASFAITDPGSTYGNDDSTAVGDIYFDLVENCVIDYADIDSASLYAAVLDSVSQNLYVTWAIYSPADTVYISDTLGFNGGNGIYNLTISVFCPQKTTGNYLSIIGQINIQNNANVAAITENSLANAAAYPNPFNDAFTVTVGETGNYRVTLRDALGRTIQSNEFTQTNTFTVRPEQTIAAGNYFLVIESANGSAVIRLVH